MHGTALRCRATGLARLPVPLNLSTLSTLSTPKTYQYIKNFFLFSSISSVVCADSVDTLFFYLNHNALCSDFSDPDRSPQPPFTFPLHQPLPVGVSADRGGVAAGVADRLIEHRADAGDVLLLSVRRLFGHALAPRFLLVLAARSLLLPGVKKPPVIEAGPGSRDRRRVSDMKRLCPLTAGIGNSPGAREGVGCFTNAARRSRNRARPVIVLPAGTGADTLRWRAR